MQICRLVRGREVRSIAENDPLDSSVSNVGLTPSESTQAKESRGVDRPTFGHARSLSRSRDDPPSPFENTGNLASLGLKIGDVGPDDAAFSDTGGLHRHGRDATSCWPVLSYSRYTAGSSPGIGSFRICDTVVCPATVTCHGNPLAIKRSIARFRLIAAPGLWPRRPMWRRQYEVATWQTRPPTSWGSPACVMVPSQQTRRDGVRRQIWHYHFSPVTASPLLVPFGLCPRLPGRHRLVAVFSGMA